MRSDLRQALRFLRRRPGFAAVAVATIAIGIGAMTVAFTGINTVLFGGLLTLRNLPGAGRVYVDDRGRTEGEASFLEYQAFVDDVPSLEISASALVTFAHRREAAPASLLYGLAVTSNHFAVLDIEAAAGRLFHQATDGPAVVVAERFWREQLGAASLTGLTLDLNGADVPVLGVVPAEARDGIYDPSVWVRLDDWDALRLPPGGRNAMVNVFGRLRDGATRERATSELEAVSGDLGRAWPQSHRYRRASFRAFGDSAELRAITSAAAVAMAMIAVVLLIAVFNLVGLLLARAVDREREMSLRGALGAGRGRLIRQLLTESLVIVALGGVAALVVARYSSVLLRSFAMQAPMPQRVDLVVDWRVALFTTLLVAGCGLLAGILPARQATRASLLAALSPGGVAGGTRQSRLRAAVVGLQLAGATMLLAISALLVRQAVIAAAMDVGFEQERAVLVYLHPGNHGYSPEAAQRYAADAVDRLARTPGVVAAAVADRVPFYFGFKWTMTASTTGTCETEECAEVSGYRVGPGYFRALNIPLRRGRELDGSAADAQSVVVSETMARQFWAESDAVGQWVALGGRRLQVVGVAAEVKHRGLTESPAPHAYLALDADAYANPITIIARTSGEPGPVTQAVAARLQELDPSLPLARVQTMRQHLDERARAGGRIVARFFLVCGGLGLLLAIVGLAGSVSYAVSQRTRELGIRAAIGATPADLRRAVLGPALRVSVAGVAAGLLAGAAVARLLAAGVSGLDVNSPGTFAVTGALLLAIAMAAAAIPGRRASRASPVVALRAE